VRYCQDASPPQPLVAIWANGTDGDALVFLVSGVGAPGVLVMHAANGSAAQLTPWCGRLGDRDGNAVLHSGFDFATTTYVFESLHEYLPAPSQRRFTPTFDGTEASEYSPDTSGNRTLAVTDFEGLTWSIQGATATATYASFRLAASAVPLFLDVTVDATRGARSPVGPLATELLHVRVEARNFPFLVRAAASA